MKEIRLINRKEVALVDDDMYEELIRHNWRLEYRDTRNYARRITMPQERSEGYPTSIYMHRQVIGIIDSSIKIDHKNRNGLDNRRENLRVATHQQNMMNRDKTWGGTSAYKGIGLTRYNKWRVRIGTKYLGSFDTEEEAAEAYNTKVKELFGEHAYLNIISKDNTI